MSSSLLLILLRNSAFFSVKIFLLFTWFFDIILLSKRFFWKNNFEFGRSILKILCRTYVRPDLHHIEHLWYSFLCLKLSKFIFMGSSFFLSILVCKIPEFWRCKLWDENFVSFDSGNIHIKESKKPGFTFSFELRTKFVWSHGLLFLVPECYFA